MAALQRLYDEATVMRMAEAFGDPAERSAVGAAKDGIFFLKKKKLKKASKSRKRINRLLSKHCRHFSCKELTALVYVPCCIDRCLLALLARFDVLMSANYGRRLFTWDRCSFFLVYGLLLHGVCAFFFTLLLLNFKSQLKELLFSYYGAALRPLWCAL
jgi:hypothetical protein